MILFYRVSSFFGLDQVLFCFPSLCSPSLNSKHNSSVRSDVIFCGIFSDKAIGPKTRRSCGMRSIGWYCIETWINDEHLRHMPCEFDLCPLLDDMFWREASIHSIAIICDINSIKSSCVPLLISNAVEFFNCLIVVASWNRVNSFCKAKEA